MSDIESASEDYNDVLEVLKELLDLCELDSFTTTEAQREIPVGTVARLRQSFEERIAQHVYEPDATYITQARRQLRVLQRGNQDYAERLRSVECHTLLSLPLHLIDFLRDHDNLYRAAVRSRARAERVSDPSMEMDVFIRISGRLRSINMVYTLNMLRKTLAPEERARMQQDPGFKREFHELSKLLVDELVRISTRLEVLMPLVLSDAELENVGPDHDVDGLDEMLRIALSSTT
jgi:hypothetical protein